MFQRQQEDLLADLTDIGRQLYVESDRRRKFALAMRRDGHIQDFESRIYRHDGSVIWISENARAVHDELTGELLYYEGMVQDITRRKSAEEARKQAEENLVRYAEELRVKNAQLEADLEMARDVQQVFLTQTYPSFPAGVTPGESCLNFCHCYQPAQRVGGDFFCVLSLSDSEAGVFICDVVGHGLRAALVTAILRGLIEELAPVATEPGRFLTQINRGIQTIFRQTEMPMLVSAFYLVVNVANGRMAYANAGHPPPFHVRRGLGAVEALGLDEGHGPALGIFDEARYGTGYRTTAAQDLIMLFTDGLFEVEIGNRDYYGQERLLAAVRNRMCLPPGELFREVLAEIQEQRVSYEFADDVCLLGVEIQRTGLADTNRRVA